MIIDVLIDAFSDVIRLVPFLFIVYLLMEWMEHETGQKMTRFLEAHRKGAPIAGALFGLVPECGFSSAASSLYTSGVISAGTLIAVYLSTSDEMLPIMLSHQAPSKTILAILAVKVIAAIIGGLAVDAFARHEKPHINTFCKQEHCDCDHGIFVSALKHTVTITLWLYVITFAIDLMMDSFGMTMMENLIAGHPTISLVTCTLLGMIPSCASSILLSELYLGNVIGFASVCAGLCANAGVGMMVLFRVNHHLKDNLKIVGITWVLSFVTGLVLELLF